MRNVEGLDLDILFFYWPNLDILDLRLVSIGALGRPNVIVLSSLTLETSKGAALGRVVNMNKICSKLCTLTASFVKSEN